MGNTPTPSPQGALRARTGEDIVCAPSDRGITRREDREELTSGLSAVLPRAPQSSYVRNG